MVTATDPTGSSSLSEAANNNTTPNNAPTTSDPSNDPISSLSNPVGAPAGKPYYDTLRTTLRATIASKRAIDEQLLITEENIYKLETNYLDDTSAAGNIIRGFDNWVKGVVVTSSTGGEGGGNTLGRKRAATVAQINTNSGTVKDDDRIFSGSSVAWTRAQQVLADTSAMNSPSGATPTYGPGQTSFFKKFDVTGGGAATPTSAISIKAGKKKKALDRDGDIDDGKPAKRSKISYGRS